MFLPKNKERLVGLYASRNLTDLEKCNCQTEKEALAFGLGDSICNFPEEASSWKRITNPLKRIY